MGGISIEPGVLRVMNDAPWQTVNEFVEDARNVGPNQGQRQRPAKQQLHRPAADGAGTGHRPRHHRLRRGGPSRTALVSREVDATHAGVFNSLSIADETRVLAVSQPENKWPDQTDNAPPINQALRRDLPPECFELRAAGAGRGRDNNSARYQQLVDALPASLKNEEYLASSPSSVKSRRSHI